jgi:hypothetical protein
MGPQWHQPPIRGERQRERVAPRRYAAEQMQAGKQDNRRGRNRLSLAASASHAPSDLRIIAFRYV